jgi:hypothetical protein
VIETKVDDLWRKTTYKMTQVIADNYDNNGEDLMNPSIVLYSSFWIVFYGCIITINLVNLLRDTTIIFLLKYPLIS